MDAALNRTATAAHTSANRRSFGPSDVPVGLATL
jgi:hypothetical protein